MSFLLFIGVSFSKAPDQEGILRRSHAGNRGADCMRVQASATAAKWHRDRPVGRCPSFGVCTTFSVHELRIIQVNARLPANDLRLSPANSPPSLIHAGPDSIRTPGSHGGPECLGIGSASGAGGAEPGQRPGHTGAGMLMWVLPLPL